MTNNPDPLPGARPGKIALGWLRDIGPILLIALCGAVGAFFSLMLRISEPVEVGSEWDSFGAFMKPIIWALAQFGIGGIASLVFVFVFANSKLDDRGRLVAIALVAGLFWKPVIEGARLFVAAKVEGPRIAAEVSSQLSRTTQDIAAIPSIDWSRTPNDATNEVTSNLRATLEGLKGTRGLVLTDQATRLDRTVLDWTTTIPDAAATVLAPDIRQSVSPELWNEIVRTTPAFNE